MATNPPANAAAVTTNLKPSKNPLAAIVESVHINIDVLEEESNAASQSK